MIGKRGDAGGARTPEELETLLEDALLLRDQQVLTALFESGATLVMGGEQPIRGGEAIARAALATRKGIGAYVADPRRVLLARNTALVVTAQGVNVMHRGDDGAWRYAIVLQSMGDSNAEETTRRRMLMDTNRTPRALGPAEDGSSSLIEDLALQGSGTPLHRHQEDNVHRFHLAHLLNDQSTRRRILFALAGVAGLHLAEGAARPARRSRKTQARSQRRLHTAASPARERELICSDGTVFTGEQVRLGRGRPPHTWRNVTPGAFPTAFTFHASFVTAPDGTVVEAVSFDDTQGVAHNHELVTCSFIIPIGPFTGYTADFVGFFVP